MKYILLVAIKLYWILVPRSKRRVCLFGESCSNHVYRMTDCQGLFEGLRALNKRFNQCRPGYTLLKDAQTNLFELHLRDGSTLSQDKISKALLPPFNYNYSVINESID